MVLPIAGIIRTLGKVLPGGATKASGKLGAGAVVVAGIAATIEPVNDLAAAIRGLALALSALAGAVSVLLGAFGVGRKAGADINYQASKAAR